MNSDRVANGGSQWVSNQTGTNEDTEVRANESGSNGVNGELGAKPVQEPVQKPYGVSRFSKAEMRAEAAFQAGRNYLNSIKRSGPDGVTLRSVMMHVKRQCPSFEARYNELAYFVRDADDPLSEVKIGKSKNLVQRVMSLRFSEKERLGRVVNLVALAALPGGADAEWYLHQRFACFRTRGEWFSPAKQILDLIEEIREACKNPKSRKEIALIARYESRAPHELVVSGRGPA